MIVELISQLNIIGLHNSGYIGIDWNIYGIYYDAEIIYVGRNNPIKYTNIHIIPYLYNINNHYNQN